MSESNKLEQILELLLAEENEKAEELLHEYVVDKARSQYEKVLDEADEVEESEESEEEAVEEAVEEDEVVDETIDQTNDFEDDIMRDNDEIESDESGLEEDDVEIDDMDSEAELDGIEGDEVEGDEDLEDKVDDLEAELEDLRAEFEKLLAGDDEAGDDAEELDAPDMEMDGEEEEFESVEYDIEESVEDEVVEEATKLSDAVAQPKSGEADASNSKSPFSQKPKATKVDGAGAPVVAKDGGEGKKGDAAKDHTPTDNIKVEPKKA